MKCQLGGRVKRENCPTRDVNLGHRQRLQSFLFVVYLTSQRLFFLSRTDSKILAFFDAYEINKHEKKSLVMSAPNIYEVIYGYFVVLWFGIVHKMCNIGSEMIRICEWAVIFLIYGRMLIKIIEIFRKLDEKKLWHHSSLISRWRRKKIAAIRNHLTRLAQCSTRYFYFRNLGNAFQRSSEPINTSKTTLFSRSILRMMNSLMYLSSQQILFFM